jgi:hypothetical protein
MRAKDWILAALYGLAIVTTSAALVMGIDHSFAAWN